MFKKLYVLNNLLTTIVICLAFLFPHLGLIPIPFGYSIPVLLIIWLLLKTTKESFRSIGFILERFEFKAVWLGLITTILLFTFLNYFFFPLLAEFFPLQKANLQDFKFVRHHLMNFIFILSMGFVIGGVYEELVFHGFMFTRFEKWAPKRYAVTVAFLITNIIFSLYHIQLGLSGVLNAFFAGCAYHGLMLRFKRNMWYATFFHGFYDAIAFTFIYLGYW